MTLDEARQKIDELGLGNDREQIMSLLRPCVLLRTVDDALATGAFSSKIGGTPDLPEGFSWPTWKEKPLSFVAQINCKELNKKNPIQGMPEDGFLTFFYDAEQQVWGFDPKDKGGWAVSYFPADTQFEKKEFPPSLPEEARFAEKVVKFVPSVSFPGPWTHWVENMAFSKEQSYWDLADFEKAPNHQVGGYAKEVQNPMELECELVTNGLYCGNMDGFEDPRRKELESGKNNWCLLLQIDTDEDAKMMWGDVGTLYYWIRNDDLEAKNFDKCWLISQCA